MIENRADHVLELRRSQIAPPPAEIDPGNHHLAIACVNQLLDFMQHFVKIQRPAVAAHRRNDAERAAVVAAILNFEIGTGALVRGIEYRRGQQFSVSEDVGNVMLLRTIECWLLCGVAKRCDLN